MKTRTVKMVDVSEWDKLVKDTYGKPYSFQQQDGCKSRGTINLTVPSDDHWDYENDTMIEKVNGPEEGISFKSWLARDPEQKMKDEPERENSKWELELFWGRNFYPDVSMIIDDLYERGLLEAGDFSIDIDW